MAVNRKADYVGNHGGSYTDMEGMSRQFTYIDHDKKLRIRASKPLEQKELDSLKQSIKNSRTSTIQDILECPASLCPTEYQDFTLRGEGKEVIEWNQTMLKDEGLDYQRLRDLLILLENRMEIHNIN